MGIVMHAKTLRTTSLHKMWLTLLTSLALIVSSVASSGSLMPLQMLSSNQSNLAECSSTEQEIDPHAMHMALAKSSHAESVTSPSSSPIGVGGDGVNANIDCAPNSMLQHDCCDTTCITVIATLLNDPIDIIRLGQTVTYPIDNSRDIIEISHSLYRPPNA